MEVNAWHHKTNYPDELNETMMDWYRKRTLGSLLDEASGRFADREALVYEDRTWTYKAWGEETNRLAKGLMALGIGPGDRVALWMTNRPEWLFTVFAIAKTGACVVPLNTRYRTQDIGYTLSQSRSTALICMDKSGPVDYQEIVASAIPELNQSGEKQALSDFPALKHVIMLGDGQLAQSMSFAALSDAGQDISDEQLANRANAVDPDSLMMICYTSGTTASPKGVMHSHIPIRNSHERGQLLGMTFDDVHLNYLPLFHIYALSEITMIATLYGSKQILMDAFDAEAALDLAQAERVTVLHGFEAHWLDLLAAQKRAPRKLNMRIGTLPSGVESTIPIAAEVQNVFGPTISGFGMTECWAFVTVSNPSHSTEQRVYASGYPMNDYEYRIVDPETGTDLPDNTKGEIWIRGYAVMKGYWDKPEESAVALGADGWLRSGDLGERRADGHLVFLGRYKDMLKVGGENVSPAEVEAYVRNMPEVLDVAIVAYPDARLTEVPVAFAVLNDGHSLDAETVTERCKGRIASFKIPRHLLILEEFPMTPSGKIRKVELREMALMRLDARK
ncbi:MAG: AMP-binding protein [Chromatiales bacterium]|nr:AMP-binding protein [Chromatiales bacterium]